MKKIGLLFLICLVVVGLVVGETKGAEEKPFKAAFIHRGSLGEGWTGAHDAGRIYIEKNMPGAVTGYTERVADADVERIARGYAAEGYNIIFAPSFGYMDPIMAVVDDFPQTVFMILPERWIEEDKTPANLGMYFGRMYQARYLSGLIAGAMTKTNKIGYVDPFPIVEHFRFINAFTLGVQEVNPKATVKVVWTMSWFDPPKEKEAALALIDDGCDILTTALTGPAVMQLAEEKGIHGISFNIDKSNFAPNAQLTGSVWHWEEYYLKAAQLVKEGKFKAGFDWPGLDYGMVGLAKISDQVPRIVKLLVEAKTELIKNGIFRVFQGPIYDQEGKLKIPEGEVASDRDLYFNMDWFVKGVIGSTKP